ncbi:uncharacterized protein H6S33_010922 [Morchella sextelata]|uniref:uncharacterized protein n=1 Tax=Morchella sextelata TaxID=1174677 RepID=UPI001D04446E|nr:uncharacterized protein H6S33_010922 [Morchella sextelata]KAH0611657.1 hypothetical protein H6S33_010922 [Morchella sextelata]
MYTSLGSPTSIVDPIEKNIQVGRMTPGREYDVGRGSHHSVVNRDTAGFQASGVRHRVTRKGVGFMRHDDAKMKEEGLGADTGGRATSKNLHRIHHRGYSG